MDDTTTIVPNKKKHKTKNNKNKNIETWDIEWSNGTVVD